MAYNKLLAQDQRCNWDHSDWGRTSNAVPLAWSSAGPSNELGNLKVIMIAIVPCGDHTPYGSERGLGH